MATVNLNKYLDKRGSAVLAHEHRLRELGLYISKTPVGTLHPGAYGVVLGLFDFAFERRDVNFSGELIEFLREVIRLSPSEIQQLEQQATYHE